MQDRIRKIRKSEGLNQKDFGARIGVAQTTIAGYENGSREVSPAAVKSICREFNVREEWLRFGTGDMKASSSLEALVADRELPAEAVSLLEKFLTLSPEKRSAVIGAVDQLVGAFGSGSDPPEE